MNNREIIILALFFLILYILYPQKPLPDFDQIARCCWKTPQEVEEEYNRQNSSFFQPQQHGGRRVGQREGQICNSHMPCHYGLDCYQGICIMPQSLSVSDFSN